MFSILYWAVLGAIAGGIARAVVPNKLPAGWVPAIAVGIVGSFAGGLPFGQGPAGMVGSVVGACVVLFLYGAFRDDS